jgi:tRNA threonylcarbamoyladenosine biosynthesis protein TsaE
MTTCSEAETVAAGRELARSLGEGSVILLYGDLGAGKTAFVRGVAEGLGINPDEVSSPTFTLIQHYRGRLPLCHVDLYRIGNPREIEELGLDELAATGIMAVEWAEKLQRTPPDAVCIRIADTGGDTRAITIDGL